MKDYGAQVGRAEVRHPSWRGSHVWWEWAMTTQVVLNIDDVGVLHSINLAALHILRHGAIRSASVVGPAAWTPGFIDTVIREELDVDIGVHLTLTSEWSACRFRPLLGSSVPSLVDARGYLHASVDDLGSVDAGEVRRELLAQVAHVRRLGIAPSHLDAHMLFYEGGDALRTALFGVAAELELPVLLYCPRSIERARRSGLRAPDHGTLANYWFAPGDRRAAYLRLVASFPEAGVGVLALHPAVGSDELEACMGAAEAARRIEEHRLFATADLPLPVRVRSPRDVWETV